MRTKQAEVTFKMTVTWTDEDFDPVFDNGRMEDLPNAVTREDWFQFLLDFAPDSKFESNEYSAVRLTDVTWTDGNE